MLREPILGQQLSTMATCHDRDGKPVMTSMLLDTAAVMNLVSQHFTLLMGWEQLKNTPIPNLGGYDLDKSIYIYGAY